MSPWYARVASASNVADAPSRLDFGHMESIKGSRRVFPSFAGYNLNDCAIKFWDNLLVKLLKEW